MYARLVIFEVGPGKRSTIEKLVDEFDPLSRAQKGFRHMFVIGDEATGEYGSFSVWESKEDAKAANAVSAPQLQQAFTGLLQGPPNRSFRGARTQEERRQRSAPPGARFFVSKISDGGAAYIRGR
jgi:heme-degrading monooxygenase HmoA